MPEGDTIHRTANRLRPLLEGAVLTRFEAPRLVGERPEIGQAIEAVRAFGKHLLITFDDGLILETHMRMTGSWHLYRENERWRKPAYLARVTIGIDGWVAVCFAAPIVRTFRNTSPVIDSPVAHLGPDLCEPDVDLDDAVERMSRLVSADAEIADVLLDQRVANGVGNVYKSEILWAAGISPFRAVREIATDDRRRLLAIASKLLRANLGSGERATVPGGLAVYGRQRQPCRRCGTAIRMRKQGINACATYWCELCQPVDPPN